MSDHNIRRIIRESGVLEAMKPPQEIHMQHAVGQVVDRSGTMLPNAIKPFLTPRTYRFWLPGSAVSAGRDRIARAGTIVRLDAHAGTPPTDGTCVIELRGTGTDVLATVTIAPGEHIGESKGLQVGVNAGLWVAAFVVNANGAEDLSIVVTQQLR